MGLGGSHGPGYANLGGFTKMRDPNSKRVGSRRDGRGERSTRMLSECARGQENPREASTGYQAVQGRKKAPRKSRSMGAKGHECS